MDSANQVIARLTGHKGQLMRATFTSEIPFLKRNGAGQVVKTTSLVVSSGAEYANRREVREAIASGERGEVQSLPWGQWQVYPYSIVHKGQEYIRLYPASERQRAAGFAPAPVVKFTLDGTEISRERAVELCGAKAQERNNSETPDFRLTLNGEEVTREKAIALCAEKSIAGRFVLNGAEVTREMGIEFCGRKAKESEGGPPSCFSVKVQGLELESF